MGKRERDALSVERIEIPHIRCLKNLYHAESIDEFLIDKNSLKLFYIYLLSIHLLARTHTRTQESTLILQRICVCILHIAYLLVFISTHFDIDTF